MLVLTRKVNERIDIGDQISITIVRIGPASVRIGIDAPPHLQVLRRELVDAESSTVLAGPVEAETV
ncbi:MAG TPA: carbon storage regulator [Pirellulales bacterium]|nr:carbon storage regulator [Pirellulales bacterium]